LLCPECSGKLRRAEVVAYLRYLSEEGEVEEEFPPATSKAWMCRKCNIMIQITRFPR